MGGGFGLPVPLLRSTKQYLSSYSLRISWTSCREREGGRGAGRERGVETERGEFKHGGMKAGFLGGTTKHTNVSVFPDGTVLRFVDS